MLPALALAVRLLMCCAGCISSQLTDDWSCLAPLPTLLFAFSFVAAAAAGPLLHHQKVSCRVGRGWPLYQ